MSRQPAGPKWHMPHETHGSPTRQPLHVLLSWIWTFLPQQTGCKAHPALKPAPFIAITLYRREFDSGGPNSGALPPTGARSAGLSHFFLAVLWPFQPGVIQGLRQCEFIHQVLAGSWVGRLVSSFCLHICLYHLPEWRFLLHYSSQENAELLQLRCSRTHCLFLYLFSFKWLQVPQRTQWKK